MASLELNQMDIYVGNLPYTATEGDVSGLFAAFGPVERVKIITDRETGQSKGFAFVTLGDQSQLNAAIEALNDYDYNVHNNHDDRAATRNNYNYNHHNNDKLDDNDNDCGDCSVGADVSEWCIR